MKQDAVDKKILLVDGHSILNRAFYGMPALTDASGTPTGAVYGFLKILFKMMDEERPDYLTVAFDVHGKTFRHEMYDAYKGTRGAMPDELRTQVPLIKEVLDAMGVSRIEKEGLEADDLLGTIAVRAEKEGMTAEILSGDRDLLQVATDRICILLPHTKGGQTTTERFFAPDVKEHYGVTPAQFIELKALQGDSSDNIPGVPKVGEKTARSLMETYGSIDEIYAHLDEISKKSIRESLAANRDLCDLSKDLATIRTESAIDYDFAPAALHADGGTGYEVLFTPEAHALYQKLGFKQLMVKFQGAISGNKELPAPASDDSASLRCSEHSAGPVVPAPWSKSRSSENMRPPGAAETTAGAGTGDMSGDTDVTYSVVATAEQAEALTSELAHATTVGYAFALDKDAASSPLGLALCGDDGAVFYLETGAVFSTDDLRNIIEEISGAGSVVLATFDLKSQLAAFTPAAMLKTEEDARVTEVFDLKLAAYLLNPLNSSIAPEDVATDTLDWTYASYQERFGKRTLAEADKEAVISYACDLALLSYRAYPVLKKRLTETQMLDLFETIEMPLAYLLYDMERLGIIAREDALKAYGARLAGRIAELEDDIHKAAGEDFNINSPKQLGEILFEKMGLPGGKKTKTGYSTAADVLEKLAPDVPFVRDVLEYRGLTKLKSTYADALASFIADDHRIHTVFHQTITATGRLSSSDPNLQNIPMRTDLGREIRKVFVPADGCVFVDADYSQIELRILAHMSDDAGLIEAYHTGKDIHAITAAKVFHVPFEEVTPLMRRNAKAVNFGIVYGISAFGLGQDLSITREEASQYMKQYFATYPGVKTYQEKAVADAKETGYSMTMYGRRRPVPELKASNFMQRSFGERVAMNAPIQGTAADIMKIAMLRVWRRLRREGLKAQVLLQIHDELLIETPLDENDTVEALLVEEMTKAAHLNVPLEVEAHSGTDWYECK